MAIRSMAGAIWWCRTDRRDAPRRGRQETTRSQRPSPRAGFRDDSSSPLPGSPPQQLLHRSNLLLGPIDQKLPVGEDPAAAPRRSARSGRSCDFTGARAAEPFRPELSFPPTTPPPSTAIEVAVPRCAATPPEPAAAGAVDPAAVAA